MPTMFKLQSARLWPVDCNNAKLLPFVIAFLISFVLFFTFLISWHLLFFSIGEVVETGFKYGQSELILNCSLPDDKVSWYDFFFLIIWISWNCFLTLILFHLPFRYHNGTLVVEADNLKLIRENSVHMLKITKPKMAHIGSYTCEGSGKAVADFRVSSTGKHKI